jgi:hypothetical protein
MTYKFNEYKIFGKYTILYIIRRNKDKVEFIIDTEDLNKVKGMCWHAGYRNRSKRYYIENTKYLGVVDGISFHKTIFLHDYIMNMKQGERIDHIDGNALNNRKENLRRVTNSNNLKNRKSKNSNNTTGYRNVCFCEGWYIIQLQVNGKNKRLGKFKDLEEAGKFAKEMRQKYYGEFAGNN